MKKYSCIDKQVIATVIIAIGKLDSSPATKIFTADDVVNKVCPTTKKNWTEQALANGTSKNPNVVARIKWALKELVNNGVLTHKNGTYKVNHIMNNDPIADICGDLFASTITVDYDANTLEVTGYSSEEEGFEPILSLDDIVDAANNANLDRKVKQGKKYWHK